MGLICPLIAAMKEHQHHVFLSYNKANRDFVEAIARRLAGDGRLSLWFAPWHAVPGEPTQWPSFAGARAR
jgi:hypothetical protein